MDEFFSQYDTGIPQFLYDFARIERVSTGTWITIRSEIGPFANMDQWDDYIDHILGPDWEVVSLSIDYPDGDFDGYNC